MSCFELILLLILLLNGIKGLAIENCVGGMGSERDYRRKTLMAASLVDGGYVDG